MTVVTDTCTYITPILHDIEGPVMTNSAKWAWYAPANLGFDVVFGSLEECVRSASLGRVWRDRGSLGRAMSESRTLVAGRASGIALVLDEPLSFWGGLDPETGALIDTHHPQRGAVLTDRVLVMPSGRGSSSSSYVLAEAIRAGKAPAAIVLGEPDGIVALGAIVARELYGSTIPVIVLEPDAYGSIADGAAVEVQAIGDEVAVVPSRYDRELLLGWGQARRDTGAVGGAALRRRQLRGHRLRLCLWHGSRRLVRSRHPDAGTDRGRMHPGPAGGRRSPKTSPPIAGSEASTSPSLVIDPFAGSANTLFWILRQLPGARGVGFELEERVFALTHGTSPSCQVPIELVHTDYAAGLGDVTPPTDGLLIVFVAPPWGDALDPTSGLDLRRTTPPVAEIMDMLFGRFPEHRLLLAIQVYERCDPASLAELEARFDWSDLRIYDLNNAGGNHGIMLGTRGWVPSGR